MRTIVFGGLYWGPLILGNYHLGLRYGGGWKVLLSYLKLRVEGLRSRAVGAECRTKMKHASRCL